MERGGVTGLVTLVSRRGREMVGVLITQRAWTSPSPPAVCLDFWTSAYQAIDD